MHTLTHKNTYAHTHVHALTLADTNRYIRICTHYKNTSTSIYAYINTKHTHTHTYIVLASQYTPLKHTL